MKTDIYRNHDLIQMHTYDASKRNPDEVVQLVRQKWAMLREKNYAADYPIEILKAATGSKVVEVFKWISKDARNRAARDADYLAMENALSRLEDQVFTEAVRGFNSNFPTVGGIELLRGVCSCLLSIDGVVQNYPMSVKNGVVLMHRSPRADPDKDGFNEMYLKILMHGGDSPLIESGPTHTLLGDGLFPVRVEQNFDRPNDGIVKSDGVGGNDFPATALWRVSWQIRTPLGLVLTDPDKPLIFGPAKVTHYPPVGSRFKSPTGPVKLVLKETGLQVGTLTPGELTAFDIVTTKDDEVFADHLNIPPPDLVKTFEELAPRMAELEKSHVEVPSN